MRKILMVGLLLPIFCFAQSPVRTEEASNRYKHYTAATTGDTLVIKGIKPVGSSIVYDATAGAYVVGILVSEGVVSDTLILKNGTGLVVQIVLASSAPLATRYDIGARVDTNLVYIQKKGSKTTLFFRPTY